jgi:2-polyprenyl-3-methyl-5-hydroxy-6-metoxy-1,4-benzoquinol methylase
MSSCSICKSETHTAFKATILNKYNITYSYCDNCGLLRTEEPYWLDEAYSNAIALADTGLVQRNLSIASKLAPLLYFEIGKKSSYLDVAGGYGMLTRLMRDFGFNYYWHDLFCDNLLAKGFEAEKAGEPFKALTFFEVMEHLHDPVIFLEDLMKTYGSKTLIFTTRLFSGNPPDRDWWYYSFNTGQHITFYQTRTLKFIAEKLGMNFYSAHGIHMFTSRKISRLRFHFVTGIFSIPLAMYVKIRMHSRTLADHNLLMNTKNEE